MFYSMYCFVNSASSGRKNKSTNLFTVDKSKLPASFRQTFETASGEAVNNLALIENAINNANSTQVVNDIINDNAIDMENGI